MYDSKRRAGVGSQLKGWRPVRRIRSVWLLEGGGRGRGEGSISATHAARARVLRMHASPDCASCFGRCPPAAASPHAPPRSPRHPGVLGARIVSVGLHHRQMQAVVRAVGRQRRLLRARAAVLPIGDAVGSAVCGNDAVGFDGGGRRKAAVRRVVVRHRHRHGLAGWVAGRLGAMESLVWGRRARQQALAQA